MSAEKRHLKKITKYYDIAQSFYKRFWHGPTLGIHYGIWDAGITSRYEAITHENWVLANLAGVKANDLVLDAGCGIGGSGVWLAQERKAKVIGVNVTRSQLVQARDIANSRAVSSQVSFVEADYQQVPLQSNSVDVFWSLESIEHASSVNRLIDEAFRVLKPGGRIVVAGMFKGRNSLSSEAEKKLQVFNWASGCFSDFQTATDVGRTMEEAGFIDINDHPDMTQKVMKSARQIEQMCRWGLPVARVLKDLGLVSPIVVANNKWGTYQAGLFKSGDISYNILTASKP